MDITNKVVKICRRISEIEHAISTNDQSERKLIALSEELEILNLELKTLQPAVLVPVKNEKNK